MDARLVKLILASQWKDIRERISGAAASDNQFEIVLLRREEKALFNTIEGLGFEQSEILKLITN